MKQIDQKINEYKSGDLEKRLNLFLTYRSLRPRFNEIEQKEDDILTSLKESEKDDIEDNTESKKGTFIPVMDI